MDFAVARGRFLGMVGVILVFSLPTVWAEEVPCGEQPTPVDGAPRSGPGGLGHPQGARRLAPDADAWIDPVRKVVIMDGDVCLREGPLEMFACTAGTKEHESIVTVKTRAKMVHAALLALGAEPGQPARFTPRYAPASGTEVEIRLLWIDESGKRREGRAQEWVRDVRTKMAMPHRWVFAGSGFWTDERTGRKYYMAEGGDFICVSNFPGAMLDLPVESTQANAGLLFEAFTERIPALGTRVRVVLEPKVKKRPKDAPNATEEGASPPVPGTGS
jgi:hypothetical protein